MIQNRSTFGFQTGEAEEDQILHDETINTLYLKRQKERLGFASFIFLNFLI